MTKTDNSIIESVLSGNTNDFAVLVDRYKNRVFSLVYGVLKDYELSQEVAQDVFVKSYSSLNKFRRDSSFSTWIYRISYNTAISETRKKKVYKMDYNDEIQEALHDDSQQEAIRKEEDQQKLNRALSALPADERMIIELYYFEEKAITEICDITGMGESNIKVKLHRLRKKLKELIGEINKKEFAVL